MSKLEIRNLVKRFGKVAAVKNLNLYVKNKEIVVLLGPSGCGKTTTLRCIAGLENPDEGEIIIDDTIVNNMPPKERDAAMVFQGYALYPHMTAYDNIAFPLKMRKIPKREIDERVKKVAQIIQIEELLNRKPSQMSGGQQQRIALGRAIVREPKIFLMDEPLSNLDAKLRVYMRTELKKLQQDLGITTIYVTHDQIEAMTIADRITLMKDGEIQQYATPSEIYSKPSNQFVAGFVGTPPMNLIECSLVENRSSLSLEAESFNYELDKNIAEIIIKNTKSSELILGIRPQNMLLHLNQVKNSHEVKVYIIENLGGEYLVNLKMGENILKVITSVFLPIKSGDKLWFTFNKNEIHIFDKKGGKTLI